MERPCEAWFDNVWWARREGNRLSIGKTYERPADYSEAILVLWLTEEGDITLDPKWANLRMSEITHARTWRAMLRRLMLPVILETKLSDPPPFCLFSEQEGMLEYLHKVATGALASLSVDEQEQHLLFEALGYAFREGRP